MDIQETPLIVKSSMENNRTNKLLWIIFGILAIAVILVIIFVEKPGTENNSNEPIKIGFIGPLSGETAIYGEPSRNGALVAVDEINAKGGIDGRMIELIVEDGKCEGKTALNAAQKLINIDNVKFIIGGACSGETMGFGQFAEQSKVLTFSYGSSNPAITTMGDYIFRNAPSDALGGSELAKLVEGKGFKNVAVVTENTDFAQGVREVFKNSFSGSIISDEVFNSDSTDFRTIALKTKATNPEAIVLNVQRGGHAARLAKQFREMGVSVQFFTFFVTGDDFVKSGPSVEGTYILDVTSIATIGEGKHFTDEYMKKYNIIPSYLIFGAGAYDAVKIVTNGIKKYGEDTDKVKQYIYDLPNYQGAVGSYTFDENGDSVGIGYTTKQIKNQTLVTVP